ncbi:MAG: hypothetical protein LBF37_01160 [Rickettsiales bacterium]|nr:hypothetical protein [Rickettsiales bacterium]
MKKTIIILSALLAACVDGQTSLSSIGRERNEKCANIKEIKVFQTLSDSGLASVCDSSYSDYCYGMTVVIAKQRNQDMWDDQRIKAPKGKCFVYDGTYKYESKGAGIKTVPILRFDWEYSAVSDEEIYDRISESYSDTYEECLDDSVKEFKNNRSNNEKMCKCVTDYIYGEVINIALTQEDQDTAFTRFKSSFAKVAEKQCGKIPKSFKP